MMIKLIRQFKFSANLEDLYGRCCSRARPLWGAVCIFIIYSTFGPFFVICSFIYDNVITDHPFSQITNFIIIGYLIKPFLYPLVI